MIDLTMPIRENDGRYTSRNTFYPAPHTFEEHGVQSSTFKMFAHFGTHVDAPRHFIQGGDTIDEIPPQRLMGRGAVFVFDVGNNQFETTPRPGLLGRHVTWESRYTSRVLRSKSMAFNPRHAHFTRRFIQGGAAGLVRPRPNDANILTERDPGLAANDIAILRTDWTDRMWGKPEFLTAAPFLTGDGARWLVDHGVKAVVYDFPEEEIIRKDHWDGKDAVVHHTMLGNDIYNIEYVVNLSRIAEPFVGLIATPLPLVNLDGWILRLVRAGVPL
ncbi:cyclase family protein [Mycobacterium servetii]|uniref:Cyclase family protein n=1 Tax=Mycobacterium servetii TaxID=3237418 RepID=A0ABV4BZU9_9MYCO